MGRVVVAKDAASPPLGPGKDRLLHLAVKVLPVQSCKHPVQVIGLSLRGRNNLAPALLPGDVRCPQHLRTEGVRAIDTLMRRRHLAREEPRHQQEREGANYFGRRGLENVRQPHIHAAGPNTNSVVETDVGIKLHFNVGKIQPKLPASRIELTEGFTKNSLQMKRRLGHNRKVSDALILGAGQSRRQTSPVNLQKRFGKPISWAHESTESSFQSLRRLDKRKPVNKLSCK